MRDDPTFVDRFHRDLRDVHWLAPAEIRARARRRTRCTAVAAAVAVLAVASLSAVAVGGRADGPDAPPVSSWPDRWLFPAEPEPTGRAEIPAEALLAPFDLSVRGNVRLGESGLHEPVRVDALLEVCAADKGVPAAQPVSRYSRSQTLLQKDVPGQAASPGVPLLAQDVYRLAPGATARVFTELDVALAACSDWREVAPVQWAGKPVTVSLTHTWQAVARDFAGDESVLLRHVPSQPVDVTTKRAVGLRLSTESRMVVRVGDLVTVIVPVAGPGADRLSGSRWTSDAELCALGRSAARRMCVAANPSC
ncbi:hypothetical protein OOK41_29405 [Micromonospora sp. NBC_01655]|uniref:hypothetical protein n=1 Tax=Micromonospora sp. NBC_01655 TaxID=2975983 RepID=UPI00224D0006|nr:hypothetical protein [Micromonospora sp. NBC_01655]MCX4474379.1 hypothetical protein [Micromonospora sp. NBC_01655]